MPGRAPGGSAPPSVGESLAAAAADVAAACVGVALLWAPQERIVWQPPRVRPADLAPPPGVERLDFAGADGTPLFALAVGPPAAETPVEPRGTLLAFHGNAELAVWGVPWARALAARTGWRVVLPEYRGYANLGGAPAYRHSGPDAWAGYAAVRARWPGPAPLALFGHSLGSAVAAELAAALGTAGQPPGALVLQAPFTSIRAMARLTAGPLTDAVWRRVARVHFDTAARVAALDAPVWVAHGTLDAVIPAHMGRRVFAAARRPGELLLVDGAGHNGVPARGGTRYWAWLARALAAAAGETTADPATAPGERLVR